MILVRYVFQVKWGKVHEVLEAFKQGEEVMGERYGRFRILTDLTGQFNTVVQEVEVESLAEWEGGRAELFAKPEFQKMMADTAGLFESGRVEFYTIES
jgi:hypothetical protein